eukprot:CAMPEP_0197073900 /NCGR_PEP_ID=MMETSP1384-20130603/210840_1 /TAXON_ID=29189 /ORGANISM="Ammonia sp." /LENGTH=282 /DNA_ID=CAMNT_0042512741 /DNA_START=10 /DNA_END=858 /DNA_ORIENTATION=-
MKRGAYFKKKPLLSDKIQGLLDEVEEAKTLDSDRVGLPQSLWVKQPQQYQEYYHLYCKNNKFYENYYSSFEPKKPPTASAKKKQQKKKKAKERKKIQQETGAKLNVVTKDCDMPDIGRCIFLVGKVLEISDHKNADSMYVEMIDIGESKPRQICSGLRGKVPKEELLNSMVIVFTNLKEAKLRGIDSNGMILCASNLNKSKIEILRPPKECAIGERVVLEDEDLSIYKPANSIKPLKKNNPWGNIKDDLKTNSEGFACYKGRKLVTSKGPLSVATLTDSRIS